MNPSLLFLCATWIPTVALGLRGDPQPALNLETAISLAARNNRLLDAARAAVDEAEGDLVTARILLPSNPELFFSAGPRVPPDPLLARFTDFEIGIEQQFPLGGPREHLIGRALALVDTSRGALGDAERLIEFAVAANFYDALAAGERLAIRERTESLASDLHGIAERRLRLGEGTALEQNVTRIRLAEARRRTLAARAELRRRAIGLAELLGIAPGQPLLLDGDLPLPRSAAGEERLLAMARASRPDLAGLHRKVQAAREELEFQRALSWPDVTVGFQYERDERDDKYMGRLTVPIPSFDRNQGNVERARASLTKVEAELDALKLAVEAGVLRALATYEEARQAVDLYDAGVLAAQEESVGLLVRAFESGEVGYADVLFVQRELLEGREGQLEARLELARARATLLAELNLPQTEFPAHEENP
jgi:cobalt-zinc-cadmium efflux system outer membrane protein